MEGQGLKQNKAPGCYIYKLINMKCKAYCCIVCLIFIGTMATAQTNVFVGPTGTDAFGFGGNAATPYRTIAFAVSAAQSNFNNAVVNVAPGTYNETAVIFINEPLSLRKSVGSLGKVVINASGRTPTPSNPYMLAIVNTSNVTIDGIEFHNFIGNLARAIWVLGSGSNITVQNCTVRNIGWTNGLAILPPNSGTVANGIRVEGSQATPLKNIQLIGNVVRHCATGYGEAITITGNVDSFLVENNRVDSNANIGIVAAGNYTTTGAPSAVNQARRGIIRGNTVSNCMSGIAPAGGIYLDGSLNCTVEKNLCYQNGAGISIGGEEPVGSGATTPGGHIVANNVLYGNVIAGFFLGTNNPTNAIQQTTVYNNTFYQNRTGQVINGITAVGGTPLAQAANDDGGELHLQNIASAQIFNNIIHTLGAKKALLASDGYTVTGLVANYNLYYQTITAPLFDLSNTAFNGQVITFFYDDLPNLQAATGLEANGLLGNPGFVNPGSGNFMLVNGALAIDKGNPVYNAALSGLTDYAGNPRVDNDLRIDCGAYEYRFATVYEFTGNGNWDVSANWRNGTMPPQSLPAGQQIIVNPVGSGTCVVNRVQNILTGASIIVKPNKKLLLPGNLVIN
jgi:hypothetical protein